MKDSLSFLSDSFNFFNTIKFHVFPISLILEIKSRQKDFKRNLRIYILKCSRKLLRRILLIRAWQTMLDISRLILSRYTRTRMTFSWKTKTKRCLRRFFELTVQTRQGRIAFYRLIKSTEPLVVPRCGNSKSSRHTSRRCIYSASRKDLLGGSTCEADYSANESTDCAAPTFSRQQQAIQYDKTRRLFLNFISQNRYININVYLVIKMTI